MDPMERKNIQPSHNLGHVMKTSPLRARVSPHGKHPCDTGIVILTIKTAWAWCGHGDAEDHNELNKAILSTCITPTQMNIDEQYSKFYWVYLVYNVMITVQFTLSIATHPALLRSFLG